MAKMKGKKVRCDVCEKTIDTEKFRVLMVFEADYEERYHHQSCSECEKDMDVCSDCILNLNFRPWKPEGER